MAGLLSSMFFKPKNAFHLFIYIKEYQKMRKQSDRRDLYHVIVLARASRCNRKKNSRD
jgi:hypothetical protein